MLGDILRSHHNVINMDTALSYNQLIFGSLCLQGWVAWDHQQEHFFVTEQAKQLHRLLESWEPWREDHNRPLSARAMRIQHARRFRVVSRKVA
jgi:hypothetical protein